MEPKFIKELKDLVRYQDHSTRQVMLIKWLNKWIVEYSMVQSVNSILMTENKEDLAQWMIDHGKFEMARCMAKNNMMNVEFDQDPTAVYDALRYKAFCIKQENETNEQQIIEKMVDKSDTMLRRVLDYRDGPALLKQTHGSKDTYSEFKAIDDYFKGLEDE